MSKIIINTDKAPQAIGPYSQAVKSNGLLFLSGQIPLTINGEMCEGDFEARTRQVFSNIKGILQSADLTFKSIIKVNVYLIDINNFAVVNHVMEDLFDAPYPARALVQVSVLPKNSEIEIEAVASMTS
jgi:reactive intermediate/imine deaminase|tara:strand:+ start:508 stop:891 length:384 start_codon:yes stop_codon:yes gene_type:complete